MAQVLWVPQLFLNSARGLGPAVQVEGTLHSAFGSVRR